MRVKLWMMFLIAAGAGLSQGCATVEGTGRKQLMIISEGQEQQLGADAYRDVLSKEEVSKDTHMTAVVRRVGQRIAAVCNRPNFAWEFNLIESKQVNAFCLPGGKIAVYTGILPVMENEAGMAAVLGHEVAHAFARHGGERVSQKLGAAIALEVAARGISNSSPERKQMTMAALGLGASVGVLLPFSREHELEADHLGLMFAARAGYDPREAVRLWERMEAAGKNKPPEFLSTHPREKHRIEDLQKLMPEAMELYEAAKEKHGLGENW